MIERFTIWFATYSTEITWFLVGWLVMAGIVQVERGNYISSLIDFGFAYLNYILWKAR
jgi:hypothetical protein